MKVRLGILMLLVIFMQGCGSAENYVSERGVKRTIKTANHSIDGSSQELSSTSKTVVTNDIVYEYIQSFKEIAMQNMRDYKIPASIILAQGVLESGSGVGSLSQKSNNHFGIKCHKDWTGETVRHDDDKNSECFRKYDDPADSYRDHALFLTSRSRYAKLFDLEIEDYRGWARGLREAGYATDPRYPSKLTNLIEKYNLDAYDAIALGSKSKSKTKEKETKQEPKKETPKAVVIKEVIEKKEVVENKEIEKPKPPVVKIPPVMTETIRDEPMEEVVKSKSIEEIDEFSSKVHTNDAQSGEYTEVGNHNLYKIEKGDTLYNISRRFGVPVSQLIQLNQIKDNSIAIGQIIRIK